MGAVVFEIAGGPAEPPSPLVKGVGTKRLDKGRANLLTLSGFIKITLPAKLDNFLTEVCVKKL